MLRTSSGEYLPVKQGQVALGRYKVVRLFADRIEVEVEGAKGSTPDLVWLWLSRPGDTRARFTLVSGVPDSATLMAPMQSRPGAAAR